MEKEQIENNQEGEELKKALEELGKIMESGTDMEMSIFLANHIKEPCEVEVEPGIVKNIRELYISEAEKFIDKMKNANEKEKNEHAIAFLKSIISKYK